MARFIALTALTGLPHHETRRERGRPSVLSRRQIHRMLENFRKTFPGFRAQSRIRRPERESRVACLTSRWRRHPFHRRISGPIYSGITQHSPSPYPDTTHRISSPRHAATLDKVINRYPSCLETRYTPLPNNEHCPSRTSVEDQ